MTEDGSISATSRHTYAGGGLEDVTEGAVGAPWELVRGWWNQAVQDDRVYEPAAMSLATVDADGMPDVRTVLLKELDPQGLIFYTNLDSAKGRQLQDSPRAAALLPWVDAYRQMRFRGPVEQVTRERTQAYWDTRPRGSQVASAASRQSAPIESRRMLQREVDELDRRHPDGPVPLPPSWGGFRLRPVAVELWVGMPSRLHDRIQWLSVSGEPAALDDPQAWSWSRLAP